MVNLDFVLNALVGFNYLQKNNSIHENGCISGNKRQYNINENQMFWFGTYYRNGIEYLLVVLSIKIYARILYEK